MALQWLAILIIYQMWFQLRKSYPFKGLSKGGEVQQDLHGSGEHESNKLCNFQRSVLQ